MLDWAQLDKSDLCERCGHRRDEHDWGGRHQCLAGYVHEESEGCPCTEFAGPPKDDDE